MGLTARQGSRREPDGRERKRGEVAYQTRDSARRRSTSALAGVADLGKRPDWLAAGIRQSSTAARLPAAPIGLTFAPAIYEAPSTSALTVGDKPSAVRALRLARYPPNRWVASAVIRLSSEGRVAPRHVDSHVLAILRFRPPCRASVARRGT
jgi:hypothetical protein